MSETSTAGSANMKDMNHNMQNGHTSPVPMSEAMAIVGMALRLPGGIRNPSDFWTMMAEKRDGLCDVPPERFNIEAFHDISGRPGTIPMNKGYYLSDIDVRQFDPSFFSLSKKELERLDPQQRQLLEVVYECMENAGMTSWQGADLGCYVGAFNEDWQDLNAKETQHRGGYRVTGYGDFALANRISYEYDLKGPSMTVKTACSSSLVCVDLACEAIRRGQCSGALVCGVNLIFSPTMTLAMHEQGVLSASGICRTFDASADGYGRGEAANAILIKPLSHALRDGDSIRAIIRGTGVNTDGKTQGMLTPSSTAQEALIRRTYCQAGIADLSSTALVECHGTGTPIGDPLETMAVGKCFGEKGVLITSAKPSVGHSEGAAGLTSLIKAVLTLEHRRIPPNVHFSKPNPKIPFDKYKLRVPTELEEWPQDRAERVSINSFGVGGVNAHVIVESYRQYQNSGLADHLERSTRNGSSLATPQPTPTAFDHVLHPTNGNSHSNGIHTSSSLKSDLKDPDFETSGTNGHFNDSTEEIPTTCGSDIHINNSFGEDASGLSPSPTEKPVRCIQNDTINGDTLGGAKKLVNGCSAVPSNPDSHTDVVPMDEQRSETSNSKATSIQLLLFSAESDSSLDATVQTYSDLVISTDHALSDIAFTLGTRRQQLSCRSYALVGEERLVQAYKKKQRPLQPRVGLIFTGQGAQWPTMAVSLLDTNHVFLGSIKRLDKSLLRLPTPLSWTIEGELRKVKEQSLVHKSSIGYPLSIAVQIGLVDIIRSWKIEASFVLGHSSGELAAAYASGAITAESAINAAARRGMTDMDSSVSRKGSMAAIGLGAVEVRPYLEPDVVIACENSQSSVTISGGTTSVGNVIQKIKYKQPDAFVRLLRVDKAYHSHHMLQFGDQYEKSLEDSLREVEPIIPFYSSVTGRLLTDSERLNPSYWRRNMEQPVLFNSALRTALSDAGSSRIVLVEIGPHAALKAPITQILRDCERSEDVYVPTLQRDQICHESLLHTAGKLFQEQVAFDGTALWAKGENIAGDLPTYQWERGTTHWAESRISREWRFRTRKPHELLGTRVTEISHEPYWRNKFALEDVPWLTGHVVNKQVIFPATGYIAMIGEAIRQINGSPSYTLKNTRIQTGLVLEYGKIIELFTSLVQDSVAEKSPNPWYTFKITSFDGSKWTEHVSGEAQSSTDDVDRVPVADELLPRTVDSSAWYRLLDRIGYSYSGHFSRLQNISACVRSRRATGLVENAPDGHGTVYSLHPATMDQAFQLLMVAVCQGIGRKSDTIAVPTLIEEIHVYPTEQHLSVTAEAEPTSRGSFRGNLVAQAGQQNFFHVRGLKTVALTSISTADETQLVSNIEWSPHVNFTNLSSHILPARDHRIQVWPLLEKLALLSAYETLRNLKFTDASPPHLRKFASWMEWYLQEYESGRNVLVPSSEGLHDLDIVSRRKLLGQLESEISTTDYDVFGRAVTRLLAASTDVFAGDRHPLHVLMEDDLLTRFYTTSDVLHYEDAIRLVANTNPHLRVLEIGAGTGGTTVKVLKALTSTWGEPLYASYTYTDISSGFMNAAKERFAAYEMLKYATLDIERDPIEQGFEGASFDLIVASNVIHATKSLNTSLGHIKQLLRPGGRLMLQELCAETKVLNYVMGFLSGWWLGEEDGRATEPFVSPKRWVEELNRAGFTGPEIVLDGIEPYHTSAGIFATRPIEQKSPEEVSLACHSVDHPVIKQITQSLKSASIDVCTVGTSAEVQRLQNFKGNVISVHELEQPTLHDLDEDTFQQHVAQVQHYRGTSIMLLPSSQIRAKDPKAAMALGFARTARNEFSIKLFTIEIDDKPESFAVLGKVVARLLQVESRGSSLLDPDWEYAIADGVVMIPRIHWQSMSSALDLTQPPQEATAPLRLSVKTLGLLHTTEWCEQPVRRLGKDQVRVKTRAVGVNFRDVLISLGALEVSTGLLGFEGAGTVVEVGSDVRSLKVSDRVFYLDVGCYATEMILLESSCVRLPDTLTFEQGAAIPCVYATAIMALVDKADLGPRQSILIHSACGGVGQAAIQVAQMLGAEIFCTVGSAEKKAYLVDKYHIDSSRIFHSRNTSFVKDVMTATADRGVDVVLNSLSGDLLHASWRCVAEFGTMIELGKRDFRAGGKLAMDVFEANRSFVGLDLWQVYKDRPQKLAGLLERCISWIQSGALNFQLNTNVYEASRTAEAWRVMQSGKHIGKIVITMPEDSSSLERVRARPVVSFDPDKRYLLVGGLGGLGRAVAIWMVEQGARNLTFLSRSASKSGEFVNELAAMGCSAQLVQGSVVNRADVETAVSAGVAPLAGIINMSMVSRDVSLNDMTFSDWIASVAPKVEGTWNLHHAAGCQLDFFLLFSSFSGIAGLWGQANYAAANTFLDGFVQYRHHLGLSASVLDLGVMAEVGWVWDHPETLKRLENSGMRSLRERDLLDAITLAIRRSGSSDCGDRLRYANHSQTLLGVGTTTPIASPGNTVVWKRDVRTAIYHNLNRMDQVATTVSSRQTQQALTSLLASARNSPEMLAQASSTEIISKAVAAVLAEFLIKEEASIDTDSPLEDVGMDSLIAMEVRNWIRQQFNVEMGVIGIMQAHSIRSLGEGIRAMLVQASGVDTSK